MYNISDEDNLSAEEIQSLRSHAPGWEAVWQKLESRLFCTHRHGNVEHKGHVREMLETLYRQAEPEKIDDEAKRICEEYCEKVRDGELLRKYRPNEGSVVSFLCGDDKYFKWKRKSDTCIKSQRRKGSWREWHEKQGDRVPPPPSPSTRPFATSPDSKAEESEFPNQESSYNVPFFDKISAAMQYKNVVLAHESSYEGLQLYFSLDRSNDSMKKLHKQVEDMVENSARDQGLEEKVKKLARDQGQEKGAVAWIESEHVEAQIRLWRAYDTIIDERFKDGEMINYDPLSKNQGRISRQLYENDLERLLYPLSDEQVMSLFNKTKPNRLKNAKNAVEADRSRMRKRFFNQAGGYFKDNDMASEPIQEKSNAHREVLFAEEFATYFEDTYMGGDDD